VKDDEPEIYLSRHDHCRNGVGAGDIIEHHAIDVWQLLTIRINLPVVWISLRDDSHILNVFNNFPCTQNGQVDERCAFLLGDQAVARSCHVLVES
jgi:hypothetical protein